MDKNNFVDNKEILTKDYLIEINQDSSMAANINNNPILVNNTDQIEQTQNLCLKKGLVIFIR